MTKPGLSQDFATLRRSTGKDANGNPISVRATVWSGFGRYGTPSSVDRDRADKAGQLIECIFAVEAPRATFKPGDYLDLRSQRFQVLWEQDVRLHLRVGLSRVE